MKVYVKNMLTKSCLIVVRNILHKLQLEYTSLCLGEIDFGKEIPKEQLVLLTLHLQDAGLDVVEGRNILTTEKIKLLLVELIWFNTDEGNPPVTRYLQEKLGQSYFRLNQTFFRDQGMTINQYSIILKIEKVKEYLISSEHTLTEIAHRMNYSSVSHLSYQFKKLVGYTPSVFRKLKENNRTYIDCYAELKKSELIQ